MKPKTASLIQLNLAVLIWGGTAMFPKGVDLPISHIVCIRSLIAAVALLIFLLVVRGPFRPIKPSHYGVMLLLGLLLGLHWLTYFTALRISSAAVAILALHTYPVFTALIEPFVFRERLKKIDIVLAVVVFAGVLIMTPEVSFSNQTTRGILLGILSGLFFMVRNLMTRKYVKTYSSSALLFWQTAVTGVLLLPVLLVPAAGEYTPKAVGLLFLLGTLFTALPQTLFSASFKHLNAKTAGVLGMLLPFYGALFGYLIHQEELAGRTILGGMIILVCIVWETVRSVNTSD